MRLISQKLVNDQRLFVETPEHTQRRKTNNTAADDNSEEIEKGRASIDTDRRFLLDCIAKDKSVSNH